MAIGKKVSPAKFLGALALAGGVAQGATSIIGGIREKGRIARDKRRAKKQFDKLRSDIEGIQITNPFADIQTEFENPFEDLTVNQQQAQFEAQQAAQSRANALDSLRGAAGGSGIAGLAQALANQATSDRARASASIGQQEARNQRLAAQGAAQAQGREFEAQQLIAKGEVQRQQRESDRTLAIAEARAGKQAQMADLRQQRREANQQIMGGIGKTALGLGGAVIGGLTKSFDAEGNLIGDGSFMQNLEANFGQNSSNPLARNLLLQQLGYDVEMDKKQ